jgi:hypothetical protein
VTSQVLTKRGRRERDVSDGKHSHRHHGRLPFSHVGRFEQDDQARGVVLVVSCRGVRLKLIREGERDGEVCACAKMAWTAPSSC